MTEQNRNSQSNSAFSEWADRRKRFVSVTSVIAAFLSAVGLPLSLTDACPAFVSPLIFVLLLAFLIDIGRSFRAVLLLILPGVIPLLAFGSVTDPASFAFAVIPLSVMIGTGTGAWILTAVRGGTFWVPAVNVAAYVAAGFLTGDWQFSLLAFASLFSSLLLSVAFRRRARRISAICCAEIGLLVFVAAVFATVIYRETGSLDRASLAEWFDAGRDAMIADLKAVRDEMLDLIRSTAGEGAVTEDSLFSLLGDDTITDLASAFFNIIPGLVAAVCGILAFEAHGLMLISFGTTGETKRIGTHMVAFTMSPVSCVLYFAAFVVTVLPLPVNLFTATAENLCLILLPGFCLLGFQFFFYRVSKLPGALRALLITIFCGAFCCYALGALYLIALYGSYGMLTASIRLSLLDRAGGSDDGPPDDGPDDGQDTHGR